MPSTQAGGVDADVGEHGDQQLVLVPGADAVVGRVLDEEPAGDRCRRGQGREQRDQRHLPLALGGVGKEAREPCVVRLCGNGLVSEQGGEEPAGGEQRGRTAFLDDPAALDHDCAIGDPDRREALGRHEDGSAGDRRTEVLDEQPLGLGVDRRHRVVEDEHARAREQRPASATRWRWPPERLTPRSPISVS